MHLIFTIDKTPQILTKYSCSKGERRTDFTKRKTSFLNGHVGNVGEVGVLNLLGISVDL